MMAMTHAVTGVLCYTALAYATPAVELTMTGVGAAFVGSVLPDIDHPSSWIGRRLLPISFPLSQIFGHRGITHSLLAIIAILSTLIVLGISELVVLTAFCVGYLVHLIEDFLSNSGIPLLWPSKRRFALPFVNTGGISEAIFFAAFVGGFAVWFWPELQHLSTMDIV